MNLKSCLNTGLAMAVLFIVTTSLVVAQEIEGTTMGTAFTYQGQLNVAGTPVTDSCDFQFALYDALESGSSVGTTQNLTAVPVTDGLFTVQLDFGSSIFTGDAHWLEIWVRCPTESGDYTQLTPRQALTPAPYALALPGLWTQMNATSPNLIGGYSGNIVTSGVVGATIGGGGELSYPNKVTDYFGTVGGGKNNRVGNNNDSLTDAGFATIAGGYWNEASGEYSTVGGGVYNKASGLRSTVSGGLNNTASTNYSTVGGGYQSIASNDAATIGGGYLNTASGNSSTVSGGIVNSAIALGASVGGGYNNTASGNYSTISGGEGNTTSDLVASVGGGSHNSASAKYTTISGGGPGDESNPTTTSNLATDNYCTVGGGGNNLAGNNDSIKTDAIYATVGGGGLNQATYQFATVSGGSQNLASGLGSTIGGGNLNTASGLYSTVPGGYSNLAQGIFSFAAGRQAKANNDGCFVWADSTEADLSCDTDNRWVARASGGVYFYTDSTMAHYCYLPAGGSGWQCCSDRNLKENYNLVNSEEILATLASVPINTWNFKSQDDSIRHIGPTAQDFYAAFGFGDDNTHISTIDPDGIALAAIQGLYAENQALKAENASQQSQIKDLESRLTRIEGAIDTGSSTQSGFSFNLPLLLVFGLVALGGNWVVPKRMGGKR